MVTEDQTDVLAFLGLPGTHGGVPVQRIDTHSAAVFLAGARAWKIKRAVRFDYLDFSSVELRRRSCEAELAVNRRTAPSLYLRVVAVTREADGALALGGVGTPVEWAIEMARFDQAALLDRLALAGALDIAICARLAGQVAVFHLASVARPDQGGAAGVRWVADGNASGLDAEGDFLPVSLRAGLTARTRAEIDRQASRLDARQQAGFVRECHGDLHLRNIVLLDGVPTLFDAIEFNPRLSCVDVLYDLAFLLMDVWHRRMPRQANVILNAYLTEVHDEAGLALLPLFLACRAAVRAKTDATAAHQAHDGECRDALRRSSGEYLELALDVLTPRPACLVAVGGLSGTGKSTLAAGVAPAIGAVPGAVVVRSDVVRKELLGVDPHARLGAEAYSVEVSRRVYAALEDTAARIVATGHSVVVDAVYAEAEARGRLEAVARDAGVRCVGFWLEAPADLRVHRVEGRAGDVSDADGAVARRQVAPAVDAVSWLTIDASGSPEEVLKAAIAHLASDARIPSRGSS